MSGVLAQKGQSKQRLWTGPFRFFTSSVREGETKDNMPLNPANWSFNSELNQ